MTSRDSRPEGPEPKTQKTYNHNPRPFGMREDDSGILTPQQLDAILANHENIKKYGDDITSSDLIYLFTHVKPKHPNKSLAVYKLFKDLLPVVFTAWFHNPDVQRAIFKRHNEINYDPMTRDYFDLFLKNFIKMSDDTIKEFTLNTSIDYFAKRMADFDITIPRPVLNYSIMNYQKTRQKNKPVAVLAAVINYMGNNDIKLKDEEIIYALNNLFTNYCTELPAVVLKAANTLFTKNSHFSRNVIEQAFIKNKYVLQYIRTYFPNVVKQIPSDLQPIAIDTFHDLNFFKLSNLNLENTFAYLIHNPRSVRDFTSGVLTTPFESVKSYIAVVDAVLNNKIKSSSFKYLTEPVVIALIKTDFFNSTTNCQVAEAILANNRNLSTKVVKLILKHYPHMDKLVEKYHPEITIEQPKLIKQPIHKSHVHPIESFFDHLFNAKAKGTQEKTL